MLIIKEMLLPVLERGNFIYVNMLNAQKVLTLNVDALLTSFICMLMLLILSLHHERSDRNLVGMKLRDSVFWEMKSHYWKH